MQEAIRAIVDRIQRADYKCTCATAKGGKNIKAWGFAKLLARAGDEAKIGFYVHPHMLRQARG